MQVGKHPKISLIEHFSVIPDPRVERTREHRLVDVLVIAVCTLLCGGESFYDMEDSGKQSAIGSNRFWICRMEFPLTTLSTVYSPR